ncbi:MAG: tRNA (cytidine(34)-2'-O)-methyltransferase [Acidobacteriota bacterium]
MTLHLALVAPEIPGNTGAVGRSAVAGGARLHLVRPLGFKLDDRHVKRAGLDYWQHVQPTVWPSVDAFEEELPNLGEPWFFSAEAERDLWQIDLRGPTVLIFGGETSGLPPAVRERHRDRLVRIPMSPGPIRSLNVSNAAAVALF